MARKQRKNKTKKVIRPLRLFLVISLVVVVAVVGTGGAFLVSALRDMPPFDPVRLHESSVTSFLYDANGDLFTQLHGEENRQPVRLSQIPRELQDAVIAIEDHRFQDHPGVDLRAIARAAWRIVTRRSFEGGSTITQQLVKNVFLTPETKMRRKIQEAILSLQVERSYTKDEILEMYLNQIHFGHGADGVQSAAKTYFGKDVGELTLAESALLAGVIRNPSRYSPYNNMEAAETRRNLVLDLMENYGYISPETAAAAKAEPIELAGRSPRQHPAPYFVDYVINTLVHELQDYYGSEKDVYEAIYRGGLRIYTTIDPGMQKQAETTLAAGLPEGELDDKGIQQPQAALVSMETKTGYIRALVGGRDHDNTKYNRAVQAKRQPGSAFKPFVYTAALDNGFTPPTVYLDQPVSIPVDGGREIWQPKNYGNSYDGIMTLRRALERSSNVVAAQLIMDVGVDRVIDYAERMGISTFVKSGPTNDRQPAIALGGMTQGVTPLDMAVAFGVLGNQGVQVEPIAVLRVEDRNGNILLENSPTQTQVLSPQTSFLMTDILKGVITAPGATGGRASIGRPAAGKTGTTQDYNDAWFVGYTPDLVTSVWVGSDEKIPGQTTYMQRNRISSSLPAQLWGNYMREAVKNSPAADFPRPSNIVGPIQVCIKSGQLPSPLCSEDHIRGEYFIRGTEPQDECDVHEAVEICPDSEDLASEYCPNPEARFYVRRPDGDLENAPTEYCEIHSSPQLVETYLCSDTALLATDECPDVRRIEILSHQKPTDYCNLHEGEPLETESRNNGPSGINGPGNNQEPDNGTNRNRRSPDDEDEEENN